MTYYLTAVTRPLFHKMRLCFYSLQGIQYHKSNHIGHYPFVTREGKILRFSYGLYRLFCSHDKKSSNLIDSPPPSIHLSPSFFVFFLPILFIFSFSLTVLLGHTFARHAGPRCLGSDWRISETFLLVSLSRGIPHFIALSYFITYICIFLWNFLHIYPLVFFLNTEWSFRPMNHILNVGFPLPLFDLESSFLPQAFDFPRPLETSASDLS